MTSNGQAHGHANGRPVGGGGGAAPDAGSPYGVPSAEWDAAFARDIPLHYAARFIATAEGACVRVMFAKSGRPIGDGTERATPQYTVGIVMDAETAMALVGVIAGLFRPAETPNA